MDAIRTTGCRAPHTRRGWGLFAQHRLERVHAVVFAYAYDNEGNRIRKKSADRQVAGRSESYRYDMSYRLIDYKVGVLVDRRYLPTRDALRLGRLGNWSRSSRTLAETRTHDLVNAITAIGSLRPVCRVWVDDNGN